MKKSLISIFAMSFFVGFSALADSYMTKSYYFNDFDGETINDENSTLGGLNFANAVQNESVLAIDATNGKLYNGVLTITFTSPIDLSNNAMLTLEGKYDGLTLSSPLPEGKELVPQMYIKLVDANNRATGGNSKVYEFGLPMKANDWTEKTLDMKTYPEEVDFSQIMKVQIIFQAQSSWPSSSTTFTSGKFLFSKIEIGELPSEGVKTESSVLTRYAFLNDFNGSTVTDANQISNGQGGKIELTQKDGRLDIYTPTGLNSWQCYYRTTFTTPIDMSKPHNQKVVVKFEIKDLKDKERENVHLRMRLYDVNRTNKIVELSELTDGVYEDTIRFGEDVYFEPKDKTFDYSKISSFEIHSYNKATTAGHIYLDYLHVGADLIPIDLSFDSFTETDGLTLSVNPKAPLMQDDAFEFKVLGSSEPVTGIVRTMLEDGKKFNFKGLEVAKSYEVALNDTLYYFGGSLTFSQEGMIKNVKANLVSASLDSIVVEFDQVLELTEENFVLKNKVTGEQIPVERIKSVYGGQEYYVYAALREATDYTLEILSEGYYFGEPLSVRAALNPVNLSVNWENVIGKLTADHWGVNDNGSGASQMNDKMAHFYEQVKPGVIRLHHKGLVDKWVDNTAKSWRKDVIEQELRNAKDTYKHGGRVMLTLDAAPNFISSTYPLTEVQEDELAAFFAQLPIIIKELGYHIDMYEFLNEKESGYENDLSSYWRMLNKIAVAMKEADPTVKCGGPAVSWPTGEIYRGFIDNCGQNMDFVSFHLYARGAGDYDNDDLFTGGHPYRNQAASAGAVADYLKEKGITHLETFLDEFNVQYVWEPYEPAHHNFVGASWMACFVKNVALQGITGLNVWNTDDGAYGLNYNTAPANLYLMSNKYLRGDVAESSDPADKVEMIPVISELGERSLLFVNRTGEPVTVVNAKSLIGGDESLINGMRLDSTTNTEGRVYVTETMDEVPTDVLLNPFGMVLLTNVAADEVAAPADLKTAYILENEIGLTWRSDAITRKGFRIYSNDEFVADVQAVVDTVYVLTGLQPNTAYNIKVATIDEYGNTYPSGETTITVKTRKMPLKINDRTVGDGFHQFNYDKNWTPTVSSKKVHDAPAYNGDVTVSKAGVSTATVKFKGHTVVLYGVRTDRNNLIKVYVDGVLKRELTKDTPFGFDSMVYYDETLTDGEHTLRIEADATFSLDRMDVFGKTFEDVTEAPEKVTEVDVLPTTNLISLKWVAPEHSAGIQYYRILTTLPEEQRIDTVYSPEFTISELQENTAYTVTIEAYDPCGNKSVSDEMQFSTVVKQCVEIAKLKGSIVVDGVADEEGWLAAQSLEITNSSTAVPDRNDLNGWFKVLWSQRYLYLYIDVTDDVKVARTDELSDLGEHDGFELYLDGNNKKTGPYSLEDAYVKALYSPVQYEEYNNVTTMVYGVSETEHGYGVEIRYNLADLRMVPGEVGKELGLDIHLNDNDKLGSYGLDNKLTWQRGSENAALNKAMLGNMVFVEEVSGLGLVNRVESLSVHPNPVVDLLNVSVSEAEFNVVIYNSQGKRLAEYKNQCQIDMTEYAAGVYMVQVIAQDKMYNAKIMKK